MPQIISSWLTATPSAAIAAPLTDPAQPDPITSAARWIEASLTGPLATAIAVIAVAAVGMLMLSGRINWRRGIAVILGCFLLFGAASLSAGLFQGLDGSGAEAPVLTSNPPPAALPPVANNFDPYAGAAPSR